jgi:hypothetical protein
LVYEAIYLRCWIQKVQQEQAVRRRPEFALMAVGNHLTTDSRSTIELVNLAAA